METKFKHQEKIIVNSEKRKGINGTIHLIVTKPSGIEYLVNIGKLNNTDTEFYEWFKENELEYEIKEPEKVTK